MSQHFLLDDTLTNGQAPPSTSLPMQQTTPWLAHADGSAYQGFKTYENAVFNTEYAALQFTAVPTTNTDFELLFAYRAQAGDAGTVVTNFVPGSPANSVNAHGALFQFDNTTITCARLRGSGFAPSYVSVASASIQAGGGAVADGTLVWVRAQLIQVSGSSHTWKLKAWLSDPFAEPGTFQIPGTTVSPSNMTAGGVALFQFTGTTRAKYEFLSVGTAGSAAPYPQLAPATPAIAISAIDHHVATLTSAAFSDQNAGDTHAASEFRVRDTADDSIVYGPAATGAVLVHHATGLPADTAGLVGEVRHQDSTGRWGAWGTSAAFATLGPPDAPAVTVGEIRRTRVKVTPSAYSHPGGAPHTARRARVRRVSTDTVVVAAAAVALSGPFYLDGLPEGPAGDGGRPVVDPDLVVEVQDEDDALAGEWGVSADFQTLSLWESGEFLVHVDVLIERPNGEATVLQSYRDFGGVNWIRKLSLRLAGVDQQIGSGELVLHRQVGELSLALLNTASALNQDGGDFAPALSFGREIEVRISLQRPDADEAEWETWEWVTLFRGITDDPSWPRKTGDISVPFRDRSGALTERLVREELAFGTEEGVPIEDVAQQLLDQTMGEGQYTVVVSADPGYLVRDYRVRDVMVWQALDTLGSVIGATFRQVETDEGAVLELVLTPRGKTDPDYTVTPSTYLENTQLATDGKNLRTVVVGRAVAKATGKILSAQLPAEEDMATDPLVLQFGDRTLSFTEDDKSTIDTQEELDEMVAQIYADVSSPPIPLEMETKLAPFAAVDDLVRWGANTVLWDQDLDGAVLVLSHEFPSPGVGRTTWRCAGKPKGKYATWLLKAVEIAGIGAVPAISDVVITHDPPGRLNLSLRVNRDTVKWGAWDRLGADPRGEDGIPEERYSVGEFSRETRTASWSVADGTHEILVHAINRDGHFVDQLLTFEVTGAGSDGDAPSQAPATPRLARGAIDGALREVIATWINTRADLEIELEYWSSGEAGALLGPLAAGTTEDTRSFGTPATVKLRARYLDLLTSEPGPWSAFSPEIFLPGGLPEGP